MNPEDKIVEAKRVIAELSELISSLESQPDQPEPEQPESEQPESEQPEPELKMSAEDEFEQLKELLNSDEWPQAVSPFLICDPKSEQDKMDRAEGILEILIDEDLTGKNFLDFGCGEGHVAKLASESAGLSVGYDLVVSKAWDGVTSDWHEADQHSYDIVLMYDLLDHSDNPTEDLKKVYEVLNDDGKVYIRFHPWCSRHATHLYHDLNKAYLHLVFTSEELKQLGLKSEKLQTVTHPIVTYKKWCHNAGFTSLSHYVIREQVDGFFNSNPLISSRIWKHWDDSPVKDFRDRKKFPSYQMEQQFLDFSLQK